MKRLLVIAFLMGPAFSFAGEHGDFVAPPGNVEGGPPPMRFPHAPRAWLGLDVSKPDETITAHLPELPPGIGFVVRSIEKGGPAESAGLEELDILWKLGDQMLVNESQLAALLRLAKPGDEITLAGFRAGKPLEVKLKLGEAPVIKHPFPGDLVDEAVLPGGECHGPMRVVNVSERLATFSTEEGKAEVQRDGEVYKVKIQGADNEVIFNGEIPGDGNLDKIPADWRRRIFALRRGLDHALDGRMMPARQPRPRVVPPAEHNP